MGISFNRPYLAGDEITYIREAIEQAHLSGNGVFTNKCQRFFEQRFGFRKALLTTSCTDALEMASILLDIQPGDEVILPAYTFVSSANAFVLRGAKVVLADSSPDHPNMDATQLEQLITPKTKAILVVHYGGVGCDMDMIMALADKHGLFVVEDAAHSIDAYYKGQALGGIGHLGCFSFHETKNIQCGEGGLLTINDERFLQRAEIIWEKGTNRAAFKRKEIDKYEWVDIGSSFLPSELTAAYLYAQLEQLDVIQARRIQIWEQYATLLRPLADRGNLQLPHIPEHATNNAHVFYILAKDLDQRNDLLQQFRAAGIHAIFHYIPLDQTTYFQSHFPATQLPHAAHFGDTLIRLPLHLELTPTDVEVVANLLLQYFKVDAVV